MATGVSAWHIEDRKEQEQVDGRRGDARVAEHVGGLQVAMEHLQLLEVEQAIQYLCEVRQRWKTGLRR